MPGMQCNEINIALELHTESVNKHQPISNIDIGCNLRVNTSLSQMLFGECLLFYLEINSLILNVIFFPQFTMLKIKIG